MANIFGPFMATSQFYLYGKKYCTKTGWKAASSAYSKPDIIESGISLKGKVYLVTGANAGIGYGVTEYLAKHGGTVYMFCRSMERGKLKQNELIEKTNNPNVHVIQCDCGVETDVRRGWEEFVNHQRSLASPGSSDTADGVVRLDALVCNAGGLDNELTVSKEGVEVTFATHLLFGTYLLGKLAMPCLQATPSARLIAVSSGGMYNTRFPKWETITCTGSSTYNGQMAYAYCKRGQVLLCEQWAKQFPSVAVVSCHPGWVDTAGVQAAYGDSKKWLAPLRNLWEGVEGIIWLAVVPVDELRSGEFYLDRSPCVKHLAGPFFSEGSFTKNSQEQVNEMMSQLEIWSENSTRPKIEPKSRK